MGLFAAAAFGGELSAGVQDSVSLFGDQGGENPTVPENPEIRDSVQAGPYSRLADTLYLVNRRYVGDSYSILDPSKAVLLTPEERKILVEANASGAYEAIDYTFYEEVTTIDEHGDSLVMRSIEYIPGTSVAAHGDPHPPEAGTVHLFVPGDKLHAGWGGGLPYIDGCFGDCWRRLSLSQEWRAKVDSLILKHDRQ